MEENPRPRQRQHIEASDAEQDDEASDDDAETNSASTSVDDQMAKKLVRYAISCEYSRTAIRRDGIKERGTTPAAAATAMNKAGSRRR